MATDYNKIAKENIGKYGTDIGRYGSVLLANLYSDRTHFVYEILQNAEDEGAKRVHFCLSRDKLEIRHDGKLFDENDVRGICGLVEGTKSADLAKIGKFGIGFKSVYAYTRTPMVYSGDEAFSIENYVLPLSIAIINLKAKETLFDFPFNHKDISAEDAFNEIAKRLRNIGARSILFLENIEEVSWQVEGEDSGTYIRSPKLKGNPKRIYVLSKVGNREMGEEEWLIFDRPLKLDGSDLKVEIAYKIEKSDNNNDIVTSISDSNLAVFFPTEKPTYLNFLIQGPYRTTPNRESIQLEDKQNKFIIEETGKLLADSISLIKELGYMNIDFLNVLPLNSANIKDNPIYATLFEKVKAKFLSNEEILPTNKNLFTGANNALLARGKYLTELLDSEDIESLFSRKNWLDANITYDRTRDLRDYLITELNIKEVTIDDFSKHITSEFLQKKSDEWMIELYSRLLVIPGLWQGKSTHSSGEGVLRTKPIIRLEDNSHAAPYNENGSSQVYLPSESKSKYKTVKQLFIENDDSLKFLKELGLKKPDIFTEIKELVLPKYQSEQSAIEEKEYIEDFEKLLFAYSTGAEKAKVELLSQLSETAFIKSINALSGEELLLKPDQVYLNTDDLRQFFSGHESAFFVSEILYDSFDKDLLINFLKSVGVEDRSRRLEIEGSLSWEEKNELIKTIGHTYDISITDYEFDGLENIVKSITKDNSLIVWKMLLRNIEDLSSGGADKYFSGTYRWFRHQPRTAYFDAKYLKSLRTVQWLIDKNGSFKIPSELCFSELSDEYEKNCSNMSVLRDRLQFKPDIFDQLPVDYKNKFELVKKRSMTEIEEALALFDKQKKQKEKSASVSESSWEPPYQPVEAEAKIDELLPDKSSGPDLEGQAGELESSPIGGEEEGAEKPKEEKEVKELTSSDKKQIGAWGENCVFNALRKDLNQDGAALTETDHGIKAVTSNKDEIEIIWLNKNKDQGKGYDLVKKINGAEIEYIEVKTKTQDSEELITITGTQWEFARKLFDEGKGEKYSIYMVSKNPKIKKIKNPIKLWKDGLLYAHPINFKL